MARHAQVGLVARWMIGLSVALNIFLLVFLGAQVWRTHHPGLLASMTGRSLATGSIARTFVDEVTSKLPAPDAQILRGAFDAKMPELVRLQRQVYLAGEQARQDIGAMPYDDAKVRADMQATDEARRAIPPVIAGAMLDALPRISPEGRRALSEIRLLPGR